MITTVQCVPTRRKYAEDVFKDFKNIVYHEDKNYTGCFNSFKDMLDIPFEDYRLHVQDDILITNDLHNNLDYLQNIMSDKKIEILSLYANPRKAIREAHLKKQTIARLNPFLMMQGVVFSYDFVQMLKEEISESRQNKYDDTFVGDVCKKRKVKAYCHIPSLVQHNLLLDSEIGNPNNPHNRKALFFDQEYFKNI